MASCCFGADIVVDGSGAGDYTTIDSAIEGSADGSVLLIKDTTGDNCTDGVWDEYIRIAAGNNENLTIRPHQDNTFSIIIRPTAAGYPFRMDTDDATGRYIFHDITFDGLSTSVAYLMLSSSNKELELNNCTFLAGSTTTDCFASSKSGTVEKITIFNNCTFKSFDNTQDTAINVKYGRVEVNGCDIDFTDVGASTLATVQGGYNTSFIVKDTNIISLNDCIITAGNDDLPPSVADFVHITGCTLVNPVGSNSGAGDGIRTGLKDNYSHRGTATAGAATTITLACNAGLVDDFWNTSFIKITGGTGVGQIATVTDYVKSTKVATVDAAWAVNPDSTSIYEIYFEPKTIVYLADNTYNNNSTALGYGIHVGMGCKSAEVHNNYSYQPNGESAIIIRCENALVVGNTAIGWYAFRWQGTGNGYVHNNTFISLDVGTAVNPSYAMLWYNNQVADSNANPGQFSAYNNILQATGEHSYCIGDEKDNFGKDHQQTRMNYNCYYYTDGAKAAHVDETDYNTLALMKAKWVTPAGWGIDTLLWSDNDINSIDANPQFKDVENGDYTTTNPALLLDDNIWIGGIQPKASGGSPFYGRRRAR